MPVLGTVAAASARGFGFSTQNTYSEQSFTQPGTYTFIVPAGVTSISMVAIGGGASAFKPGNYTGGNQLPFTYNTPPGSGSGTYYCGGGGALAYKNSVSVSPGQSLTVVVGAGGEGLFVQTGQDGGDSYVEYASTKYVHAGGGKRTSNGGLGGTVLVGDGGGAGGKGGAWLVYDSGNGLIAGGGGGGAGGYTGAGGAGGSVNSDGASGSGGGAGGGGGGGYSTYTSGSTYYQFFNAGGAGGGTGLYGLGSSGAGGTKSGPGIFPGFPTVATGGGGGSNGVAGAQAGGSILDGGDNRNDSVFEYGLFGGAGGAPGVKTSETISTGVIGYSQGRAGDGCCGAVRIIWAAASSGITRAFPSTNAGPL